MKRNIICFFVLMLLITIVIPVTAITMDNSSNTIREVNIYKELKSENVFIKTIGKLNFDILDQQQTYDSGWSWGVIGPTAEFAQSFKPTLSTLTKVQLLLLKQGNPTGLTIAIRSSLTGGDLTSIYVLGSNIVSSTHWHEFNFADIGVIPGQTYYIVWHPEGEDNSNNFFWRMGNGNPYSNGNAWIYLGMGWEVFDPPEVPDPDFCFKTYGVGGTDNPPVVVIESPADGTTTSNPTLTVTGYASDDIGVASFGRKHEWTGDMQITSGTLPTPYPTYYAFSEVFDLELGWNRITIFVSDSSGQHGEDQIEVYYVTNQAPNKPITPSGPNSGKAGNSYTYSTSTTDPDGDQIYYQWDWGHEISPWDGPYNSGDPVSKSHIFPSQGSYIIKVKAKDTSNEESVWSDPLSVSMPKNKPINNLIIGLQYRFQNIINIFFNFLNNQKR